MWDLDSLKTFVETKLQINGRWSTPRGENLKFSNPEFSLKWDGEKGKTVTVMQDNDENQLYTTLRSYATFTDARVDQNLENKAEHMSNVDAEADITPHETSDSRKDSCEKCQLYDEDLTKLLVMVNEVKEKQNKECQNTIQTNPKIKALLDENNKMAAEISALKTTVEEINEECRVIKLILGKKQHEWTKTEINSTKAKGKKANNTINPVASPNRFKVLEIQNMPDDSSNESVILEDHTDTMEQNKVKNLDQQMSDNCKKQSTKFENLRKEKLEKSVEVIEESTKNSPSCPEKSALVIGDSMVKNIDQRKLERAAKKKTVCHSYSEAKVGHIREKIQQYWNEDQQYEEIILHVGTNDLVHEKPEKVADEMEALINTVKAHTRNIAVSSVVIIKLMLEIYLTITTYCMNYVPSITLHSLIMIVLTNLF